MEALRLSLEEQLYVINQVREAAGVPALGDVERTLAAAG